jgi:hypothetical protein
MFFNNKKVKCLFKCDKCETILVLEFEEGKDLEDVREDKVLLECMCSGICMPLRD